MRPIHLAKMEKTRPVLVLTRELARPYQSRVTIAPITSTVRGLSTEIPVGPRNGLDHDCVVSIDNIETLMVHELGRQVGYLLPEQEPQLHLAISIAFDLT